MSTPRPVRIARPRGGGGSASPSMAAAAWVRNSAGEARALRLFGLFAIVLVTIYLAFLALAESGAHPGVGAAPVAWATFTVLAGVLGVWGWSITFGRTPRSAQRRSEEIVVRERLGRLRRFARTEAAAPRVLQRYDAGFLGPSPTVLAEMRDVDDRRCAYLVEQRYFEALAGAA